MPHMQMHVSQEVGQFVNNLAEHRDWDYGDILEMYFLQGLLTWASHLGDRRIESLIARDWQALCDRKAIPCEYEDHETGAILREYR